MYTKGSNSVRHRSTFFMCCSVIGAVDLGDGWIYSPFVRFLHPNAIASIAMESHLTVVQLKNSKVPAAVQNIRPVRPSVPKDSPRTVTAE